MCSTIIADPEFVKWHIAIGKRFSGIFVCYVNFCVLLVFASYDIVH